jgi:hypothetical protein
MAALLRGVLARGHHGEEEGALAVPRYVLLGQGESLPRQLPRRRDEAREA